MLPAKHAWHAASRVVVHEATTGKSRLPLPPTHSIGKRNPMKKMLNKVRGASMVEYALLLVAILLLAAGAFKALGPKVGTAATRSGSQL
jgi:Flp pilus assembly pilin Flp